MPILGSLGGARGFGRNATPSAPVVTPNYVASFGSVAADAAQAIVVDSANSKIYLGLNLSSQSRTGLMDLTFSTTDSTLTLGTARRFQPGARTSGSNAYGYARDSSGNMYLSGSQSTDGNWLLKVNSSYTYQWAKRLTGAGTSFGSVGVDSSGNVYTLSSGGYLVKYNSSGEIQWQRVVTLSGSTLSAPTYRGLAVTSSGDCHFIINNTTNENTYILKYNSSGTLQYQKNLGLGIPTTLSSISVNSSGDVFVAGSTTLSSVENLFWAKYNSSGVYQYSKRLAVNAAINGTDILISSTQSIYVLSGSFSTPVLAKYSSSGDLTWQRTITIGGTGSPFLYGLGEDSAYQVFCVGWRNHTSRGSDIFLLRLSQDGTPTTSYTHRSSAGSITTSSFTAASGTANTNSNGTLTDAAGAATDTTLSEAANLTSETGFTGTVVVTGLS